MKYIDAEKLNSLIETKLEDLGMSGSVWVGRSVLNELKEDIESLQQEQPEVDLEKEIHKFFEECIEVHEVPLYGKVKERVISVDCYEIIAYHFYKLGQSTKYQQDREEFSKLKAKEWQDGYDEGYERGLNAEKERNKV